MTARILKRVVRLENMVNRQESEQRFTKCLKLLTTLFLLKKKHRLSSTDTISSLVNSANCSEIFRTLWPCSRMFAYFKSNIVIVRQYLI